MCPHNPKQIVKLRVSILVFVPGTCGHDGALYFGLGHGAPFLGLGLDLGLGVWLRSPPVHCSGQASGCLRLRRLRCPHG